MPVLPVSFLLRRRDAITAAFSSISNDSRILDSRESSFANAASRTIATATAQHLRRLASSALETLSKRSSTPLSSLNFLQKRASHCPSGVIAECYADLSSPLSAGAVAGITLGSVAGFILVLYILWILSQGGNLIRTAAVEEEDIVVSRRRNVNTTTTRERRSRRHQHRSRSRGAGGGGGGNNNNNNRGGGGGGAVNVEIRERSPRRERVVRQERIIRDRLDSIPPPREPSRIREVIVESSSRPERRVDGDDVVEVFEEHSELSGSAAPPPRRASGRRGDGYRRSDFNNL